ncbi:CamS family sex pheromone protein [Oceanobacillus halotolerans]|uniref:CamS family sex pheromone protein n=1 Tax=Oceanobacillus halotolerans TaxID=2663380 RepID=UPI0013D97D89|nr:CamS family sex pheromone protein [Oceanobacillus halotolerans]
MKKITIYLIGVLLFLTSCAPDINEDEVLHEDEAEQETSIVPSYQLSEENYRMVLPYKTSAARGVITNQMGNRLDIDEMEEGLRRHSKEVYDPETYYFQEGQYLTEDTVYEWLGEGEEGFNPEIPEGAEEEIYRENPRYLSHILEQNFLRRNEDNSVDLVGVSLGIALKSVYRFQTEIGGPYYYEEIPKSDMLNEGKEIAQSILERVREIEGLEDVPILIGLYREAEQGSPVPGNYVALTNVDSGSRTIDEWESIDEEYILFPSDEAEEKYFDEFQLFNSFANEIATYFPNYVGAIGEGFYINEELRKLTIEVPLEFYGKAEVIGFTQYTYGVINEMFPNYYDLEIKINSDDKMESLIYRDAGDDNPTVHIFH